MTSLFHRRRPCHQSLCVVLALVVPLTPVTAVAQQSQAKKSPPAVENVDGAERPKVVNDKTLLNESAAGPSRPLDLTRAVPNTILLVALRPAQILNAPIAEMYPTEILQAAGLKELGIDPLTAESIVFAMAPTIGGPPSYSALVQFNAPLELKPSRATEHAVAAEVAGKPYFQSNDPMLPSLAPLDDSTLLVAPDYFFRNLVSAAKPAEVSPFSAGIAAADQGDDLLAMVDVSQLRTLISMGLNQAPVPPEFASLKQLPNLIKFVEVRLNLSRSAPSSVVVTANNEADAEKLIDVFEEMKQLMAAKWTAEAQAQLASEDPVEQAAGRYSLRMARLADDRLQLQREADQVILLRSDLTGGGSNPLVATAMIGTLVGLLLPAVQAAREAARRTQSTNNLRQIMLALLNYESENRTLPAHASHDDAGKPLLSWRVHVLPYLGQQTLHKKFRLDEPWDSEHNRQLIALMPEVYVDPSSGLPAAQGKTHYLGVKGEGRFFTGDAEGRKMASVTDGTSNTIAVVQVGNAAAVTWTKPDDWQVDEQNLMRPFDPLHPGGFLAGLCDGSVRFISENIDPVSFKALLTAAGDEPVGPNDY